MKYSSQITLMLCLTALIVCNGRYEEHPDQEVHAHIKDKDYTNLPFTENWDKTQGQFTVKQLNVTDYDAAWQGAHRSFNGDNYYTVQIKGGESVTLTEFAYEVIDMTKAVVNYHCGSALKSKVMDVDLKIYDHEHRVYYKTTQSADILAVYFKETTDFRMTFTNPNVSLKIFF